MCVEVHLVRSLVSSPCHCLQDMEEREEELNLIIPKELELCPRVKELKHSAPVRILVNIHIYINLIQCLHCLCDLWKCCLSGYGVPAGLPNGQANTGKCPYSVLLMNMWLSFYLLKDALSVFFTQIWFGCLLCVWFSGYGVMPDAMGTKGAGASSGKGLKGGAFPLMQPSATPQEGAVPQLAITQGAAPVAPAAPAPEPTSGILVMVTQDKYQKQPSPGPQGKGYKLMQLIATPEPAPAPAPEATPEPAPAPEPAPVVPQGKGLKEITSGPEPLISHGDPEPEPAAVVPQGKCCELCSTWFLMQHLQITSQLVCRMY